MKKIHQVPLNDKTIKIIQRVAKKLANKYTFGYVDAEDVEQEAFIIGMGVLNKYDPEIASLETFLYIHISNRLKNMKRDNYFRKDFVCRYCGRKDPNCEHCKRREWRLAAKKHLLEPVDIDNINCDSEKNICLPPEISSNIELNEILSIINQKLDVSLREDYLRWKDGVPISKNHKQAIEECIMQILEDCGYYKEDH